MAHDHGFSEGKQKFIEPSKVAMPRWRTTLVILYSVGLLLRDFIGGRIKKLFGPKSKNIVAKK